jgi:hypothetical protein
VRSQNLLYSLHAASGDRWVSLLTSHEHMTATDPLPPLFSFYIARPPVILYCLSPNTTHKLQLLDVGVFEPLQPAWARHMQVCAAQNNSVTHETVVREYLF